MIPKLREAFNADFKKEYYEGLFKDMDEKLGIRAVFRVSETPVFVPKVFENKVFEACDAIIDQIFKLDLDKVRDTYIPKGSQAPGVLTKPKVLAIDFGFCEDSNGGVEPQLIELQAFPSLFFYQPFLGESYQKNYPTVPDEGFHYYFSGLNKESFTEQMRKTICGDENPEHVILLEIFPEKQKTRIDFFATEKALGIKTVCMTQVIKEGNKLFYDNEGKITQIKRIYNRVIVDELDTFKDINLPFKFSDTLEVEWVAHPDWFFMISKAIMPHLEHKYIPKSYYLSDYPADLDFGDYVLKPLFSFAGKGINLRPDAHAIAEIEDKQNYILQQKVTYASIIRTNTAKNSKVELRILYILDEENNRLKPVVNLTRMSKGELINVNYATEDSWIGSSICFFED